MLTTEQIERFKEEGVLMLPGFFNSYEIYTWKDEISRFYQQPKDHKEWQRAIQDFPALNFKLQNAPDPFLHPKMKALFASLNNFILWEGSQELAIRSPQPEADWIGANAPHLDYPLHTQQKLLANTIFYLNDVSSYNAPFMYWKESHKIIWEYFRKNPTEYGLPRYYAQQQTFNTLARLMDKDPVAFYGKAGDLLLWHPLILHSPSVNISFHPRLAFVGRWGAALVDEEDGINFSGDMWKQWRFSSAKTVHSS